MYRLFEQWLTGFMAVFAAPVAGSTLTISGASTLTGGIVAASYDNPATQPLGSVAYASLGTSAVHVAGTKYYAPVFIPSNRTITGVKVLNGVTVGTDNIYGALATADGTIVAASSATLSAGANAFQTLAFATPYAARGPGYFWIVTQCNGTTATTRRIAASTHPTSTGSAAGVAGTLTTITPSTTFTADVGPIAHVY